MVTLFFALLMLELLNLWEGFKVAAKFIDEM